MLVVALCFAFVAFLYALVAFLFGGLTLAGGAWAFLAVVNLTMAGFIARAELRLRRDRAATTRQVLAAHLAANPTVPTMPAEGDDERTMP